MKKKPITLIVQTMEVPKKDMSIMCLNYHMHPYECNIATCPQLEDHIWYDLQVIKSLLLNR